MEQSNKDVSSEIVVTLTMNKYTEEERRSNKEKDAAEHNINSRENELKN